MESKDKPVFETTTEEGTKIRVEAQNIPPTGQVLKEKFAESFPPSNKEIDENLQEAKETLEKQKGDLNQRGKLIATDAQELINTASKALNEKNKDEKLQKLYEDSKKAAELNAPVLEKERQKAQLEGQNLRVGLVLPPGVNPQKLQAETKELYAYIKNLLWNFLKSDEFRSLAADWISFFQFLGTKKIKQQALKQETEGGVKENIAKAVEEGLEETSKPADEEELERRTQEKFDMLMDRLQSKLEYQDSLRDFFRLLDQLRMKWDSMAQRLKKEGEKVQDELETQPFWDALNDAQDIIVGFTGRENWEEFKMTFDSLYKSIKNDPELNQWFWDFRSFMDDILENPENLKSELYRKQLKELLWRGRRILREDKWNSQFNDVFDQFKVLLDRIKNDSTSNEFVDKLKKLGKDLAFNAQGYPDIFVMEDSIIQIKNLLIPILKDQLGKINIARVDFINDTYDVRIQDLAFSGSFLPEHIDFHMKNDSHMDTQDSTKDVMRHVLQFQVANIKPEFKNFKFYYKRKSFPQIEDYGVADMKISGQGALLRVTWKIESKAGYAVASLAEVKCHIDKLELHIVGEKTKHDILDAILAPLVAKNIKNKISTSIEDYLLRKLSEFNDQINQFLRSRPVDNLQEKANVALQEAYKKGMEETKSVSAV